MTDKEKQVAEMAKVIKDNAWEDIKNIEAFVCAEELYNAGYRKIDDHAIMVLRKAKGLEEKIRNQAVKEFARELRNEMLLLGYDDSCFCVMAIEIIAKQFGVDLGE